jgi:hypothetical protein
VRFPRWQALLACAVLTVALPLAACGDDDDDNGDDAATVTATEAPDDGAGAGDTATGTPEPDETPEGDETATEDGRPTETADPGDDSTATVLPTVDFDSEDASYANDLCSAFQGFYDNFQNAFLAVTPDAETDPLEGFIAVFSDLRDAVADIDPPGRYEDFHAEALAVYEQLVKDLEEGNPEPLAGIEVPEVDVDLQARLASAAAEDPVCQEVEEDFGTSLFEEE